MPSKPSRKGRKARRNPNRLVRRPEASPGPRSLAEEPQEAAEALVTVPSADQPRWAAEPGPQPSPPGAGRLRVIRGHANAPKAAVIKRDYGYVRGELLRIVVMAGAIFVAIGLLAVFWR